VRGCSGARIWLATVAVGAVLGAGGATARADPPRVTGEERISDRVVTLTVATTAFTEPTKVDVIFPVGYDANPSRRWPVTYITAGTMNNYNTFRTFVDGVKLAERYPSIIVSPDGNSGYWSDWYNGGAFGAPKYETFVIDELIDLIDRRYRTLDDRAHRVIFGISMGGYGTMMLAAHHPDLFAAAATLSGAVDSNLPYLGAALSASSTFDGGDIDAINGPRATQEVRWHGRNPTDLAENLRDTDLQVRSANGIPNPGIGENPASADTVSCIIEEGVYQGTMSFHARLDALGKKHLYKDYGAGCHTVPNFRREIVDTLAAFQRFLADPPPPPASIDYRSIEPRFDVWGWHVDADPARPLEFLRMKGDATSMTFAGSGRTSVTTPSWYRGLKLVDAGGTPTAPDASGRLRLSVDLGPPNAAQQYTPGAVTNVVSRTIALVPYAVVRIGRVGVSRRGVRVCARAIGGPVTARVRLRTAHGRALTRSASVALTGRTRCRALRWTRRPAGARATVTISGSDRFGHPVHARRAIRLASAGR